MMYKSLCEKYLWLLVLVYPFIADFQMKHTQFLFDIKPEINIMFETNAIENMKDQLHKIVSISPLLEFCYPNKLHIMDSNFNDDARNRQPKATRKRLYPFVAAQDLGRCIAQIEEINAISEQQGNDDACLSCDPTLGKCPAGCQIYIEKLWRFCRGVQLPDGLYFDPRLSVSGTWDDEADKLMIIEANRCGCSPAMSFLKNLSLIKVVIINVSISAGILFLIS